MLLSNTVLTYMRSAIIIGSRSLKKGKAAVEKLKLSLVSAVDPG